MLQKPKAKYPILTSKLRRKIVAAVLFLIAIIFVFSFFKGAGKGGELIFKITYYLIGKTIFLIPLILALGSLIIFKPEKKRIFSPIFLGVLISILSIASLFNVLNPEEKAGGIIGYFLSFLFYKYFGFWVSVLIFSVLTFIGFLIFYEFFPKGEKELKKIEIKAPKIIESEPKIKLKTIPALFPVTAEKLQKPELAKEKGEKPLEFSLVAYKKPPIELLERDREKPSSGDIQANSLIIKRTLSNFGIPVEMSEINIGPTVTQYTLKPAEGIKLSKITVLANDLSLTLAAHPIRIEAPVPGRALVGIEVPNKIRAKVRLRDLIDSENFKVLPYPLTICLGRDVSGMPIFTNLEKMPHLLVAGSTGSGKTICLNTLILSLIYRNSPQILKFILIDPKRVEFPVYNSLPHLLSSVIFSPKKTVAALNWLTQEMERRFDVLSETKMRDIGSYNEFLSKNFKNGKKDHKIMPYLILIIDELADLMAVKEREIEAGIVRLAQMSRAVGIHLIVATQRPSVEVITGLIKANITARIAFQVASQIDSRTILDGAGAETLLGEGDMLFISPYLAKPKRIQGVYMSSKEVKRVVDYLAKQYPQELGKQKEFNSQLDERFDEEATGLSFSDLGDDLLYEDAKRIVIEAGKASASLLQRRLKIGYARAARLLDILEQKGIVGPLDGAKPREILRIHERDVEGEENNFKEETDFEEKDENGWKKI